MPTSVFDLIDEKCSLEFDKALLSLNTVDLCVTMKFVLKKTVMLLHFG